MVEFAIILSDGHRVRRDWGCQELVEQMMMQLQLHQALLTVINLLVHVA